ncbi:SapC family protein [Marinobacter xestospongiae]|uniref:SapC family protein n=1 Tax=Marinobacter xestospongiae TaxID=994319 RepID=A0ABU3W064_9GAMM|nr:SapC family protein [Marinobacter xestospongiae]MDV2079933.1 SapC family protein [Marinobacter xestospongiae]
MTDWVVVSRDTHVTTHFRRRQHYGFSRSMAVSGVVMSELEFLVGHYVMAFIEEGDSFLPVALLGGGPVGNAYLDRYDQWQAPYTPALLRGFPFGLGFRGEGAEPVLGILRDQLCQAPEGEPLFESDGTMTEVVRRTLDLLRECDRQKGIAVSASACLQAAGVISPWAPEITINDEAVRLNGLFQVNERKLSALDESAYSALRGAPMTLAVAQRLSMAALPALNRRLQCRSDMLCAASSEPDLDQLFSDGEDDVLSFGSSTMDKL